MTFVRHEPDGTTTEPHIIKLPKGKHGFYYMGYPDDCSEDLHFTITAEPVYEDSSIQTEPVTIELEGMKIVAVSNLQGAIKTVGGACVATFTWEWEYETPQPVSWAYRWFGPDTSAGIDAIADPDARRHSFTYSEAPCPDEGMFINVIVSPVLSDADAKTTLVKPESQDIYAPVVKKEDTSKPTDTSEATHTAENLLKAKRLSRTKQLWLPPAQMYPHSNVS